jgi:cytoskeletal protein RodZ
MSHIVVAIATTTLFVDSQRIHVSQGAAWASDSVVVELNPELFSEDPTRALGLDIVPPARVEPAAEQPAAEQPAAEQPAAEQPAAEQAPVEQAPVEQKTAAPGEKSNVKKSATSK